MLQSNKRLIPPESNVEGQLLKLLLFIDRRSSETEKVKEIQAYLKSLQSDRSFELEVVEIEKQPHLVEYLKLIATPALVKMLPTPRQILAGSDLLGQLKMWLPKWKATLNDYKSVNEPELQSSICVSDRNSYYAAETIKLKDEIFRLKQEKQELAAQLRFNERLIGMLAHDLRTPLTAASMAVETIERAEANPQLTKEKLAALKQKLFYRAKSQFKIMNSMIGELLQNSKSMNAKLQIKPAALDLQSLCREIAAQFDGLMKRKSMTFTLDIPQDLPLVYADEELIRHLLSNLLDNAIKYTPQRGSISLSILHRTNQKVQVSLCDTGPGIPPEERSHIFEDSFRLKRDRGSDGYGLGLATCRQIVCAHHGQIWVESSPQSGSCFQFTLLVYK